MTTHTRTEPPCPPNAHPSLLISLVFVVVLPEGLVHVVDVRRSRSRVRPRALQPAAPAAPSPLRRRRLRPSPAGPSSSSSSSPSCPASLAPQTSQVARLLRVLRRGALEQRRPLACFIVNVGKRDISTYLNTCASKYVVVEKGKGKGAQTVSFAHLR